MDPAKKFEKQNVLKWHLGTILNENLLVIKSKKIIIIIITTFY